MSAKSKGLQHNDHIVGRVDIQRHEPISVLHSVSRFLGIELISDGLEQWSSNLAREIHFPAEFSSNPNHTHLSMLINVFRIIRKSQVDVWSGLELNSAGKWISFRVDTH